MERWEREIQKFDEASIKRIRRQKRHEILFSDMPEGWEPGAALPNNWRTPEELTWAWDACIDKTDKEPSS